MLVGRAAGVPARRRRKRRLGNAQLASHSGVGARVVEAARRQAEAGRQVRRARRSTAPPAARARRRRRRARVAQRPDVERPVPVVEARRPGRAACGRAARGAACRRRRETRAGRPTWRAARRAGAPRGVAREESARSRRAGPGWRRGSASRRAPRRGPPCCRSGSGSATWARRPRRRCSRATARRTRRAPAGAARRPGWCARSARAATSVIELELRSVRHAHPLLRGLRSFLDFARGRG